MNASLRAFTPAETSPVRSELGAMRSIVDILEHLPNDEARARVLDWVARFFESEAVAHTALAPRTAAKNGRGGSTDPYVAVAELSSFFEAEPPVESPRDHEPDPFEPRLEERAGAAPTVEPDRDVVSMVHSFVADFQKLAKDWQG